MCASAQNLIMCGPQGAFRRISARFVPTPFHRHFRPKQWLGQTQSAMAHRKLLPASLLYPPKATNGEN